MWVIGGAPGPEAVLKNAIYGKKKWVLSGAPGLKAAYRGGGIILPPTILLCSPKKQMRIT